MYKKIKLPLFGFLFICIFCSSNPVNQSSGKAFAEETTDTLCTEHFMSNCFVDDKNGWAVGVRGTIFQTVDGGLNWHQQKIDTKRPLNAVSFCNTQVGWVVGSTGFIFNTLDGGKTWAKQDAPKNKILLSVKAISPQECWAVGDWGTILHTKDGGKTWKDETYGEDLVLYDIDFISEDVGWIAGEMGTILHTTDGGASWQRQETGTEKTLFGLSFDSAQNGIAVGLDAIILKTSDEGKTWQKARIEQSGTQKSEDSAEHGLYNVAIKGNIGVAVGDSGTIYTSVDGGDSWKTIPVPLMMRLFWLRGVSIFNNKAIVVGANSVLLLVEDEKIKNQGFIPALLAASPVCIVPVEGK